MAEPSRETGARLHDTVRHLALEIGPRPPGSRSEGEAALYLAERSRELGLETRVVEFESASHGAARSRLLHEPSRTSYPSLPSQFSAAGEARGELRFVGDCGSPAPGTPAAAGSIGLIMSSGSHAERTRRILELERQGMLGLLVASPHLDEVETKLLRYPEVRVPVAAVSLRTAVELRKHEGEPFLLAVEGGDEGSGVSRNVVATLPGSGESWLVVGAHVDTAPFCPGAGDNASGVAVVLELARRLRGAKRPATVVFLWSGSEEYGGLDGVGRGALAFYRGAGQTLSRCIGHVDIDDVGNPIGVPQLSLSGPLPFRRAVLGEAPATFYRVTGRSGVGADHGAAEQHGIPYVWATDLSWDMHPQLHTPADTPELLDFGLMARHVDAVSLIVERLARIGPVFPVVREGELTIRAARSTDIPGILEVTRLSFGPVSGSRMREEFFGERLGGKDWQEWKCAEVQSGCESGMLRTVVAELEGRLVGYATYGLDEESGIASIGNNAVHPAHQGRGIGSRLQREVDRRMHEEGYVRFEVDTLSLDLGAQRMYEKLGYRRYAETYRYLRKG